MNFWENNNNNKINTVNIIGTLLKHTGVNVDYERNFVRG